MGESVIGWRRLIGLEKKAACSPRVHSGSLYSIFWRQGAAKNEISVPGLVPYYSPFLFSMGGKAASAGETFRPEVLPTTVKPGGICLVRISGPASLKSVEGEFRGEKFPLPVNERNGKYEGLLGIDLNTRPGKYEVGIAWIHGERGVRKTISLKVEKVDFPIQHLRLPRSMVDLNSEDAARVNREEKRLKDLFRTSREQRYWKGAFLRPVPGEITTPFGLRRRINGRPKNPHTGIDLRGEEGAPVLASNDGVVVLAEELFFAGNSILIDHGWGVYSMYFHLSKTLAGEGEILEKGAVLGRVGSTGRSSGPHLHFGVVIRGARVDPLALLKLTQGAGE